MRFAHLADIHIGSWRDPKLKDISTKAFIRSVNEIISHKVDFVLIAGDLFHTAVPGIEFLKSTVTAFKKLKDADIPVYGIPGSHDFSPTGKTMIDVLEEAGLFTNVFKGKVQDRKLRLEFTVDPKTGAKITGIIGKKGMLDRRFYEALDRETLENEKGDKIFLFHTGISELMPSGLESMDSAPMGLLPKGFSYYAGGHIHYIYDKDHSSSGHGRITFPGALFPANFAELEKHGGGGYYIVEDGKVSRHEVIINPAHSIIMDCEGKSATEVSEELMAKAREAEVENMIITLRLSGKLREGKPSDIRMADIYAEHYGRGAYFVMKNTAALSAVEFEEKELVTATDSVEEIESLLIAKHAGQQALQGFSPEQEKELVLKLMAALNSEKDDGEKVADYEKRIMKEAEEVLNIKETKNN